MESTDFLNYLSYFFLAVVIGVAFWGYNAINKASENKVLIKERRWIEQIPTIVSTTGVIGTFLGITLGLIVFKTDALDSSIPLLLSGLKTAFFTSLAGMIGSLILSRRISKLFDAEDGGVSDANMAAGLVVKAVEELKNASAQQSNNANAFYANAGTLLQIVADSISNMNSSLNSMLVQTQSQTTTIQNEIRGLGSNLDNISTSANDMKQRLASMDGSISNSITEILEQEEHVFNVQSEISENVKALGVKLHDEVVEIEDAMSKTNTLLEAKFDEFSELLRKGNTEALVEAMKQMTVEFNNQMSALINKLVQENFDQLNKSVERLNTWQIENKEMIAELTSQYKTMADNFGATGTVLTQVGTDARHLVSDGGKLQQLLDSLNEVMIKDEKFRQISQNLAKTAELTEHNMNEFDKSTSALNEWVRKQRNFVDSVEELMKKLEEISKMREYGEQFWQETKAHMDEGVGIIRNGSQSLNQQLTHLDNQFYSRLSATLAQLDACIQAMIENQSRLRR